MRYLWLAFLVGWSGSTYAAVGTSPSVDVPITISPSGPTPPPGAVAAGFTTLAANYDFTQTLPSNWLDCGTGDGAEHQWYQGVWWAGSPMVPCNVLITTDGGSQVIDLQWKPSMKSTAANGEALNITTMSKDTSKVVTFPNNAYYEIEVRYAPTVNNPECGSPLTGGWMYNTKFLTGTGSNWEVDIIETYGNCFGSYDGNFAARGYIWQGTSSLPAGYDPTQYNKYAVRLTSDGTAVKGCSYINNSFISCNGNAGADVIGLRNFLILNNGQGSQTNNAIRQTDMFVRHYRVWSCATWATTNCNGALNPPT
jgi:hypothetical protein